MRTKNQFLSRYLLMAGLVSVLFWSCERVVDGLEAPANSNNPEVFIDGFSGGLNYAAFGGSVPSAFDVDREVTFGNSKMSMRFAVPDVGDPRGAYAGGTFFTSTGRDLSEYDALTFWGRASQPANIDVIGFGNDLGANRYQAVVNGLRMNTNWQKYIIPLPDASKLTNERGMFLYSEGAENQNGYTFWVDELKFEKLGTVAHQQVSILGGLDVDTPAEVGETFRVTNLVSTHNLPSGLNQSVGITPHYLTFASSDESIATVDATGLVTVVEMGIATITARLGEIEASGSMVVNSTLQANRPTTAPPVPTQAPADVISLFTNAYTNVDVDTWNTRWEFSTAEESFLNIAGQDVIRYRNLNFVGIEFTSNRINATNMTHFRMDVWTPDPTALPAEFKILLADFGPNGQFGGGDDTQHELTFRTPTLQTEQWFTIDVPLSQFTGLTNRANLAQMVLSGSLPNVYVSNVYFYRSDVVVPPAVGPTTAPPAPTQAASDVISLYTNAFSNVSIDTWNTRWEFSTADESFVTVAGQDVIRYENLNFVGIEFVTNRINATNMTHFRMDVWTPDPTALPAEFKVQLVDFGPNGAFAGGDDTSHELTFRTPTLRSEQWFTIDVPLSQFTGLTNRANLAQMVLSGSLPNVYITNVYFYRAAAALTAPATAAPTPTTPAADVISIFSPTYTNIAANLNPGWQQATQVTFVNIGGRNTMRYGGLNYQGIELGSAQNVSTMQSLHIDLWTANSTAFSVFLISPGPVERAHVLTVPTNGWSSVSIPMSAFSGVNLSNVFQLKFEGNGDIYIGNLYFRR